MELLSVCVPVGLYLFLSFSVHLSPLHNQTPTNTECIKCIFMSKDCGAVQQNKLLQRHLRLSLKT